MINQLIILSIYILYLGGGFIHFFYFHPENWERFYHFDEHIFQKWVGSTTNQIYKSDAWLHRVMPQLLSKGPRNSSPSSLFQLFF